MLTLYHAPNDELGLALADALKTLVIAHHVQLQPDTQPYLIDGEVTVTGAAALWAYIAHLEDVMSDWNAFQSDSCYIHPQQGSVC